MFGYEFFRRLQGIMKLVKMKIMYKSKESLHYQVLLLILDSIESYMFSTFKDVMTVMIEYFFKLIQTRR